MDLVDRLECAGNLLGFLTDGAQERIVRILTKIFEEQGMKRGIEECASTMRSLADQAYETRKKSNKQIQRDA